MTRPSDCSALVTGASRGIGAAIARALAEEGFSIGVNYRADVEGANRTVEEIEQAGGQAMALQGDVANGACDELFSELEERFGPTLVLVNNAGIRADGISLQLTDDDWEKVLQTNLTAAFRLTRKALRGMLRARYGRVVNIASVSGPRANVGQANYAAAKAGLIGLTKTISAEVARKGVTVNAIAPGFIETSMTTDVPAEVLKAIPARRSGKPEEVAACVRFLASDAASYVTGTTLFVDGGLSA